MLQFHSMLVHLLNKVGQPSSSERQPTGDEVELGRHVDQCVLWYRC